MSWVKRISEFAHKMITSQVNYGVEIINASVTKLQKQIFEILWQIAVKPLETLKRKRVE